MMIDTASSHTKGQSSATLFERMFESNPDLLLLTDTEELVTCNQNFLRFLGYDSVAALKTEHRCISERFEECPGFVTAITQQRPWAHYVMEHPQETHYVKLIRNTRIHIFELSVSPIDFEGKTLMLCTFHDVTDLHQLKERYEFAINGSQEGLWDWDLRTNEIYFSTRWKSMLGFNDDELPNALSSWSERVHPDDKERALRDIAYAQSAPNRAYLNEHRLRHKEGHWVWILDRGMTLFDQNGRAVRMIGTHTDLTRIKESEELNAFYAQRSEALLLMPALSETLDETLFMQRALELAEDLTRSEISFVHFVNDDEKTIELITWSRRTLQEYCQITHDRHYPVNQAGIWADALRKREAVIVNDYPAYPTKKGLPQGHAPLQRFISLPVISEEHVVMLCGVGNKASDYDTTDVQTLQLIANEMWRLVQHRRNLDRIRQAQELLLIQSRHAAMGEMIGMIAHQWRQPISVISMGINNMIADIDLGDFDLGTARAELDEIMAQTQQLSGIIDQFRNAFRPDAGKKTMRLGDLIQEALGVVGKSLENNAITCDIDDQCVQSVDIYAHELLQVMLNILTNAKEALIAHRPQERLIRITTRLNSEAIIISICNNGGPINETIIHEIFNPYVTTKPEQQGKGLGLYIAKTMIQRHFDGVLRVINQPEGVCFEILLPLKVLHV